MNRFGDAMRAGAVREALDAAEDRWFAHARRHELVYAAAHAAAALLAAYVLLTAPAAAGYHARRALRAGWLR